MALPTQPSFADLGTPLSGVTFCVVDIETTGGSPGSDAITEVGAVKVRGGEVLGTFQTLVDPGREIPPSITVLTGITQAMVLRAPTIESVLPSLCEFAGDAVIVGHNVSFDLRFLNAACDRLGYARIGAQRVDTVGLARRLIRSEVRNLKLATLARHFRSPTSPTHRALDDARATLHVFHELLERAGSLGVTHLEDLLQLPTARGSPHYRKIHLARELPRRPGVYWFTDSDGRVIYVGKAKNLRTRVSAYFHGDERRSIANLLRELDDVGHQVCAGELEASITELRLIWAHRPRHNRRSRPPKATHWLTLTNQRFPRLSITRSVHPDALATLGPFRSRKAADQVRHALWDATPLRRCSATPGSRGGRCAAAQMGNALCPCDGTLRPAAYRTAVDAVVEAVGRDPSRLLDPLEERMRALARQERYEEAAQLRDRHRALARSLQALWHWQALVGAGRVVLERADGECAVVDQGRLVDAWRAGTQAPLLPPPQEGEPPPVPGELMASEEATLVWRWMQDDHTRLVDSTGGLALPAARVPTLDGDGSPSS